jgi:hypothetical protein
MAASFIDKQTGDHVLPGLCETWRLETLDQICLHEDKAVKFLLPLPAAWLS